MADRPIFRAHEARRTIPHADVQERAGAEDPPAPAGRWLEKLVGEWMYEAEARSGANGAIKAVGAESVRPIGDLLVMAEGDGELQSETRGNGALATIMTLAYDPRRRRFAGTWTGPQPAEPFVLDGALAPGGEVLTLRAGTSTGAASPVTEGFRTELEFEDEDHLVITAWDLGGRPDDPPVLVARFHRWR